MVALCIAKPYSEPGKQVRTAEEPWRQRRANPDTLGWRRAESLDVGDIWAKFELIRGQHSSIVEAQPQRGREPLGWFCVGAFAFVGAALK